MLIDVSNINYGLVADMETIDTNSLGVFNEMETIVLVSKFGQKHICWICGVHMPNYNYIAEAGLCADCRTNENVNALFVTQELPFQLGDIVTFSQRGKRLIVYDTQTRTGFSKTWSVHLRYIGSRKRKMINQRTPQEDYPVLVGHSLEEYVRNFDFWQQIDVYVVRHFYPEYTEPAAIEELNRLSDIGLLEFRNGSYRRTR